MTTPLQTRHFSWRAGQVSVFYGNGEAVSAGDTAWPLAGHSGQPLTLELHLRPLKAYHEGIPHILTLCDRYGREILYLGQWKNHLVMRLFDDNRWFQSVKSEKGTGDHLLPEKPVILTFVFSSGGAALYADGILAEVYDGFDLTGTMERRPVQAIILGNSSNLDSPWEGEIHGLSVFTRALDATAIRDRYRRKNSGEESTVAGEVIRYQFDRLSGSTIRNEAGTNWDLLIPETLTPLRREYLALPLKKDLVKEWFYVDALVNLIGFVPLGFILALFFGTPDDRGRSRTAALTVSAGFILSLFIEFNQAFLVSRTSSLTDLVLNSVGTGIGVLGFLFFIKVTRLRLTN